MTFEWQEIKGLLTYLLTYFVQIWHLQPVSSQDGASTHDDMKYSANCDICLIVSNEKRTERGGKEQKEIE